MKPAWNQLAGHPAYKITHFYKGITHMKLPFKIHPPEDLSTQIKLLSAALDEADCIIAGAGAGLSTSAGFL